MGGDAISPAGYLHDAYTAAFHVAVPEVSQWGKIYRALRQVGEERRLVKRYEFLISPPDVDSRFVAVDSRE